MTKFKAMYTDEVVLSELPVDIERFKRLVQSAQSSGSTLQSNATALGVLQ